MKQVFYFYNQDSFWNVEDITVLKTYCNLLLVGIDVSIVEWVVVCGIQAYIGEPKIAKKCRKHLCPT